MHSAWDRACARATVVDANIHDLKSKGVTDGELAGRDMQLNAGHASRKMTESYIKNRQAIELEPLPLKRAGS